MVGSWADRNGSVTIRGNGGRRFLSCPLVETKDFGEFVALQSKRLHIAQVEFRKV